MQVDAKKIDEFVERLIKDNTGQEVTVELVCRIAGRTMATALNEFSKVPTLEQAVISIEERMVDILEKIEHSDGNVKLMTNLLDKYLSHNKMSDACVLKVNEIIEDYLEKTKDSLIKTITDTIDKVLVKNRQNNSFWMGVIKWIVYMLPVSGIGYMLLGLMKMIHELQGG